MEKRNRGAGGHVPSPEEIKLVRGRISQTEAGKLVYVYQCRFSQYENGDARMHPSMWELFQIKIKRLTEKK